jgi:hypothetical protein
VARWRCAGGGEVDRGARSVKVGGSGLPGALILDGGSTDKH